MASNNKVAIITGGSGGLGAVIAERLGSDGFAVVVNYARAAGPAEALVKKIAAAGGKAIAVGGDVSDSKAVKDIFDQAEKAFGGVDVLVNCAGTMSVAPLAAMDDTAITRLLDINLKGSIYCMREAARRMRDGGSIINVSSSVTRIRQPAFAVYGGTKGAIEVITTILAKELGNKKIRVNAVAPGPVATDLLKDSPKEELDHLTALTPLKRLGQPGDISTVVSFLAAEGGWVNGQTIFANGGIV